MNKLTTQEIEIAVARHFNYRANLIVPNVWWGWNLRHEADMIVMRPSGYCDEVEIKITRADIVADKKKRYPHFESRLISRLWFAVPIELSDCQEIPKEAGILSVERVPKSSGWWDVVKVVRPAKLIDREIRLKATVDQRVKLSDLGAMRIWDLKISLARKKCLG